MKKFIKCSLAFLVILALLCTCGCSSKYNATSLQKEAETNANISSSTNQSLPSIEFEIDNAPLPATPQEILSGMTIEEQIAQLFIVTPEQLLNKVGVTTHNGNKLRYPVGGVVLFSANIKNPSQCMKLINSLQNSSKIPLFMAVDEEGGMVARVANNDAMGSTKFPNMCDVKTTDDAYNLGKTIGQEIGTLGFNLDFAPVADVNSNPNNTVIGDRSFGADPTYVSSLVAATVKGFNDSGMLCTLKHFPGHGDTDTDSHSGYTHLNKTLEELHQVEFVPFKAGINAGAPFIMLGHLAVPKVTGDSLPATMSNKMIDILRSELGFKKLIITDSMQMGAITQSYSSGEAAVTSLKAGVDVILMPENLDEAISAVIKAVKNGEISKELISEKVLRILEVKISAGII